MSLQIVSHYRITCDVPACVANMDAPEESWDEFRTVKLWEAYGGVSGTWEHARAYCENHKHQASEDDY